MKKIIIGTILSFIISINIFAWENCPYGEVNEPYPGTCGRYIDTDNDKICDLSQVKPKDRIIEEKVHCDKHTEEEIKEKEYKNPIFSNEINYGKPLTNTDIEKDENHDIITGKELKTNEDGDEDKDGDEIYHLLPITLALSLLYIITYILLKNKKLKLITHRRIWNILLLISFLVSGILAILLIISINYGTKFSLPFNILFWHVEIGIVMLDICVIHIIERRQFFYNMIK